MVVVRDRGAFGQRRVLPPRSASLWFALRLDLDSHPARVHPMSRLCLRALQKHSRFAYRRPQISLRAASTLPATKAADNLQSLIREKLNGVTNALADIASYADWQSMEKEAEGLKIKLQVRMTISI